MADRDRQSTPPQNWTGRFGPKARPSPEAPKRGRVAHHPAQLLREPGRLRSVGLKLKNSPADPEPPAINRSARRRRSHWAQPSSGADLQERNSRSTRQGDPAPRNPCRRQTRSGESPHPACRIRHLALPGISRLRPSCALDHRSRCAFAGSTQPGLDRPYRRSKNLARGLACWADPAAHHPPSADAPKGLARHDSVPSKAHP